MAANWYLLADDAITPLAVESNPSNPVTSNEVSTINLQDLPYCDFDHFELEGYIEQLLCSHFCFHLGPFLGFLHLGWQVGDGMWDQLRPQQGITAPDQLTYTSPHLTENTSPGLHL